MNNALSFDLEYWYSAEFVSRHLPSGFRGEDGVMESVTPILELLARYNTRATFFVLGTVAERYPDLIGDIFKRGHEIASHGYSHRMLHDLGREEFAREIDKSVNLLESITGSKPIGFRAPSFSLDNTTSWALEILRQYGFKYDSSIFPIKTPLYGMPDAPRYPYRPSPGDITRDAPDGDFIEAPLTVFRTMGANIPVAGGFYFRVLPLWFLKLALRRVNRSRPAIVYLHPWETLPSTPRLGTMPRWNRLVSYWGMNSALRKLERLLPEFDFKPLGELLLEAGGEVK